jgi:hypothetical protein
MTFSHIDVRNVVLVYPILRGRINDEPELLWAIDGKSWSTATTKGESWDGYKRSERRFYSFRLAAAPDSDPIHGLRPPIPDLLLSSPTRGLRYARPTASSRPIRIGIPGVVLPWHM